MSSALLRAELFGLLFWLASLVFLPRVKPALVVAWHAVGAALSVAAPVLVATRAQYEPASLLVSLCLLGVINGLLGAAWCARLDPPVSKVPMLGLTASGFGLALLLGLTAATPTRLF